MSLLENYLKEGKITSLSTNNYKDICGLIVTEGELFNLVEEFFTDDNRGVIDRAPITISFAIKLRDYLNEILNQQNFKTEKKETVLFKIKIDPKTMKQLIELNENNNHVVWVMPEKIIEITYVTPMNETINQEIWFPETMFEVYNNVLSVYYLINKKKYYVLLPNIYNKGSVCMGDNPIKKVNEFNEIKNFIDYHEDLFFNSPFNTFHYTLEEITQNLKQKNIWQIHKEVMAEENQKSKTQMLLQYLTQVK